MVCCAFAAFLAAAASSDASAQRGKDGNGRNGLDLVGSMMQQAKAQPEAPRPLTDADFHPRDPQKEALGRLLFFDKILSGNLNISCATCHHPLTDTGDGLSLPVGEGGIGLGMARAAGDVPERVPRNAPHVFNIGAREFTRMFHDGRAEEDPLQPSGFRSPAGDDLPLGLDNIVAVQAMFPPTSTTEMAGQSGENPVGTAAANGDLAGPEGVWAQLAGRVQGIPDYVKQFIMAFDDVQTAEDITFVHIANAIAAYESAAFRADRSPFDHYLRGNKGAMSKDAIKGMKLFYGRAACADCHSGSLQTNHGFAAVAMPQIGPGKGHNLPGFEDGHDDLGREAVTGDPEDRFRFRVPSLRNVALTGPWGHAGAYDTLEAVVRHQLDPVKGLKSYDMSQAALPPRADLDAEDFVVMEDGERKGAIAASCELMPVSLSDKQVNQLIAFLHALTDPRSLDLRKEVPMSVPSGLPVFD
jgi:cytochrome c peroxidase